MIPNKIYVPTEYTDTDIVPVGVTTKQVFPRDVCYIRKDALVALLKQEKDKCVLPAAKIAFANLLAKVEKI